MNRLCQVITPLAALLVAAVVLMLSAPDAAAHSSSGLSLRVSHSGKCMDLKQESLQNGGKVQQYQCHGNNNQRFEIIHHADAYHSFKFLHSGKCLTAIGSTGGTQLEQHACTYGNSQKFTLGPYGFPSYQMQNKGNGMCVDVQGGSHNNSVPVVQTSCDIYSSSQLWAARHFALFCCRLNSGPFGQYYYFYPSSPSWYEPRVDDAVTSWNLTGTTGFQKTTNYQASVVDFLVLDPGTTPPYDWLGVTVFKKYDGTLVTLGNWWDGDYPPFDDWDYAEIVFNEGLTGPSHPATYTQLVAAHEFGHAISLAHTTFAPPQVMYPTDAIYPIYEPQWNDAFNADVAY